MKTLCLAVIMGLASLLFTLSGAKADDIPFYTYRGIIDKSLWYVSNGWSNGDHQSCEWREKALSENNKGLRITLSDKGGKIRPIACGELHSHENFGYGRYEARMKTAEGSGLNTAFFTFTGPPLGDKEHDEIDFEFLGKNPRLVQASYWRNAVNYDIKVIDLGFDTSADFHDYVFEWHPDKIIWYADGKIIHETSGKNPIPVNPGKLYFSLWSGAKSIDDWLGPFAYTTPKTAEIAWVKFTPFKK